MLILATQRRYMPFQTDDPSQIDPSAIATREDLADALNQIRKAKPFEDLAREMKQLPLTNSAGEQMESVGKTTLSNWTNKRLKQPTRAQLRSYLTVCQIPLAKFPPWFDALDRVAITEKPIAAADTETMAGSEVPTSAEGSSQEQTGSPAADAEKPRPRVTQRAGWISLAVGVAVLGVLAIVLSVSIPSPVDTPLGGSSTVLPSSTTSAGPPSNAPVLGPRATFESIATPISPSGNVSLVGTVSGLDDHAMWILEQTADAPEKYVISSPGPVRPLPDETWRLTAANVGDGSDRGSSVTFLAVSADPACDRELSAVVTAAGEGEPAIRDVPRGCVTIGNTTAEFTD